jgi:hypothetical protein
MVWQLVQKGCPPWGCLLALEVYYGGWAVMELLGLTGLGASLVSSCGSTLSTAPLQGPDFGLSQSSACGSLWPPIGERGSLGL